MNKASYLEISLFCISTLFFLQSCKLDSQKALQNLSSAKDTSTILRQDINQDFDKGPLSSEWEELTKDQGFIIDIRYATKNNFMKKKIYDCSRCLMRKEAARALVLLNEELVRKYNYRLKLFDCYRPKDFQQRLWDIMPDINYVAHPSKGSMHNRGVAIDITIVDSLNRELDMGTEFDFFGKQAHYDYTNLSKEVLANRKFLRAKMEQYGFAGIRTEWWHFSHKGKTYPISNYRWSCDKK
jgi:D-alanyl-D-alanine dipeptidase